MSAPQTGAYGDNSQVKALAGIRNAITKYDEVVSLGIESGNSFLEDELSPIILTLPLTAEQFRSATFVVNYHAVLIVKQHLHADPEECDKWEKRRDSSLNKLKGKIESDTALSTKARTFISKSNYRSINLRRLNN